MPPLDRPETGIVFSEGPGEVRAVRLENGLCVAFAAQRMGEVPPGTICRAIVRAQMPGVGAFLDIGAEAFLSGPAAEGLPLGARLLVQVNRAASGDKPMGVTRNLTWETPALALTRREGGPGDVAAARSLPETERARLKAFLTDQLPPDRRAAGFSVTARGPALERKQTALAADLRDLLALADGISVDGPPGPVGGEASLGQMIAELGADSAALPILAPLTLAPRLRAEGRTVELAPPSVDPFAALDLDADLIDACAAEIPLPGGGRLWVEPTRALTAIDLDSGSDGRPAEMFVTEALQQVARLLRLRNLGGTIVIDPPRLGTAAQGRVLAIFKQALVADPVASDLLGITRGGLIEVTRPHRSAVLTERLFGPAGQALAILRALVYGPPHQGALPVTAAQMVWLDSAPGQAARHQAAQRLGHPPQFRIQEG